MSTRKFLLYGALAIAAYILYRLLTDEKNNAAARAVASGAGQVGQADTPVPIFQQKSNFDLPYGPPPADARPPEDLVGPTLPDGSFFTQT